MSYSVPSNEPERLDALRRLNILDTDPEEPFDQIADAVQQIFDVRYSAVSLMPAERQWFKASCGLDFDETPREDSFCTYAILDDGMLVVEDATEDERFVANPLVTGSTNVRFYAGIPLTIDGFHVGTLCAFDDAPRRFSDTDRALFAGLAEVTSNLLRARLQAYEVGYLTSALEQVDAPVCVIEGNPETPSDARLAWVNEAYVAMSGKERQELEDATPWIFEQLTPDSDHEERVRRGLETGESVRGETSGHHENGEPYFVAWVLAPVRNDGRITHWAVALRDITERKMRERQLEHEATHDPLTGLLNRAAIEERIRRALSGDGPAGALLYLDLDRFKQVNDTYGHSAGDQLLEQVAQGLTNALRDQDALGRVGGDEFIAWLAPSTDREEVGAIARRLEKVFEQPFTIQSEPLQVGCSIGLVADISDYDTPEAALQDADMAMYEAKASEDQVLSVYESSMTEEPFLGSLSPHEATVDAGFETFLQPTVHLVDGSLVGFEALARWRRENGQLAPPETFLETAEETGMLVSIGHQVIEGACQGLQSLRNGEGTDLSVTLSGNFSRDEFFQDETYEFIRHLLDTYDFSPANFTMEITERLVEDGTSSGPEGVEKLKALGVNIEVDDFGTGYSSLHSLLQFPADGIKIDKALTAEVASSDAGRIIARSVIEMGHDLDLYVTAEGIETPEQLAVLRDLGCRYGQGYLFSEPVPVEEVEAVAARFPLDLSTWQSLSR